VELDGARVGVTGATGFVGRNLVRVLRNEGARVVAIVRSPDRALAVLGDEVDVRRADLADPQALRAAMAGTDAIVANAALVSVGQHDLDTLVRNNVAGTENTLHAAADAGVRRAVLVSSATIYRPRGGDRSIVEDDPIYDETDRPGPLGRYAFSKALAERAAWRLADERGLALTTVRPHQIHGAGDAVGFVHWTRRLMKSPVTVFPAYLRLPSVYVGDLALAVARMLDRRVAVGKAYNVAGDGEVTWWRLLDAYAAAGGRRAPVVIPVPAPVTRRISSRRAAEELGFRNRPLVDGFREMLALEGM